VVVSLNNATGRELDELAGRHRLPLTGQLVTRLMACERVTLPLQLTALDPEQQAAQQLLAANGIMAATGLGGQVRACAV
jgi:hypothetical protein